MKYSIPHAQKESHVVLQVVLCRVHVFPLKTGHKDKKDYGLFTAVEPVIVFLAFTMYSLLLNSQPHIMQFYMYLSNWFTRSWLPAIIPAFDLLHVWK